MGYKHLKRLILILYIIFSSGELFAQFVLYGDDPASIRWGKIEGESYKVIYPRGADSLAKRYLWLLEQNKPAVMLGLGGIEPVKIPVVIHNHTLNSNGTVVWAPKRMELYSLPSTGGYSQNWETQLAIHEGRHVGQMTYFTKGIYKLGSVLIGQQAPSVGVALYPSRWLLEGGAVIAETELTNSGRGRSAEFMEYYRASFLEGEYRDWDKWKLGSLRYYTPSLYNVGYLLNSMARYKVGRYGFAGELFNGMIKKFYIPGIKSRMFRKYLNYSPKEYFKMGISFMDSLWRRELPQRGKFTEAEEVLDYREKNYVEYLSPVTVGKDSVIYIKYSYNAPTKLVLAHNGEERVLRSFSTSVQGLDCRGDEIYFTERVADARWSNRVYGKLYRYNWRSNSIERLSDKTFYLSPKLNTAGDSIVVEEYFPDGGTAVAILNAQTGEKIKSINAPFNGQITESVWLNGDIYALVITGKGLGLFRLPATDFDSGEWETVVQEQAASITNLNVYEDSLYFISDIDGVRNIYMLEPVAQNLMRVTNSKHGASEPYISDGTVYYSQMGVMGKHPVKIELSQIQESESQYEPELQNGVLKANYKYIVADELSRQAKEALGKNGLLASQEVIAERNGTSIVNYTTSEKEFADSVEVSRYSKLGNLFRFHSWAPLYYDVERLMEFDFDNLYEVLSLGATAYSQNTLGTAVTMLGYSYHDNLHAGHFKFKYSGLYPVFQISADVNADERFSTKIERDSTGLKSVAQKISSPLVELGATMYLPLNLSSHGWQRSLIPQISWEYNNNEYYSYEKRDYIKTNMVAGALQYTQMKGISQSEIFPEWGFGILGKVRGVIDAGENFGTQSSLHLYGYIPGFWKTHGVKLAVSGQKQNVDGKNYYLGNMVNMPRGYKDNVYGEQYFMGSFDYALPIYLGDVTFAKLLYLKRLQLIPFVDYAINKKNISNEKMLNTSLYSYGLAAMVDFNIFSIAGLNLSAGVRYSINGNNGGIPVNKNSFQVVFSTALF